MKAHRWWVFAKERFEPISHLSMVLLFFLAHVMLSSSAPFFKSVLLFTGTLAFFFKLRLYDEIKDYELDCRINPHRPLVRGLLLHRDLYQGIGVCIVLELFCFGVFGWEAESGIILAIAYSLLMFKEFFISQWIRPHLTTYALSHTIVSSILSLALFSALNSVYLWNLSFEFYAFALGSWCLFNIFEFGRKTFLSSEERPQVESYSKIFGRLGAVILVVGMALGSIWLLSYTSLNLNLMMNAVLVILLLGSGIAYAFLNRSPFGKIYRGLSSAYIVLVYLNIVLMALLRE